MGAGALEYLRQIAGQKIAVVDQRHRRNLAPGQDKIANADLLEIARVNDPLVDPLEPAAHHHDISGAR